LARTRPKDTGKLGREPGVKKISTKRLLMASGVGTRSSLRKRTTIPPQKK